MEQQREMLEQQRETGEQREMESSSARRGEQQLHEWCVYSDTPFFGAVWRMTPNSPMYACPLSSVSSCPSSSLRTVWARMGACGRVWAWCGVWGEGEQRVAREPPLCSLYVASL